MLEINSGASVTGDFKDMKITFTLFSPPLGLTKKDLGVEIVYKTISAEDFEYKIAVPANIWFLIYLVHKHFLPLDQ